MCSSCSPVLQFFSSYSFLPPVLILASIFPYSPLCFFLVLLYPFNLLLLVATAIVVATDQRDVAVLAP